MAKSTTEVTKKTKSTSSKKKSVKITATSTIAPADNTVAPHTDQQWVKEVMKRVAEKKQKQTVKIKLDDNAKIPAYAHDGDLGMDITATAVEYDRELDAYIYHTGIYMESKRGLGCFIMPRSSIRKTNAYLTNSVGLIETFLYRGEFILTFKNRESLAELDEVRALKNWSYLPWYKRIFTRITDCIDPISDEEALYLAPYNVGDKIGQIVWLNFPEVELEVTDKLSETERGVGGHGSTGK